MFDSQAFIWSGSSVSDAEMIASELREQAAENARSARDCAPRA